MKYRLTDDKERIRFYHNGCYRGELILKEIPLGERKFYVRVIAILYNNWAKEEDIKENSNEEGSD